jgi:hypothetical protein
MNRRMQENIIVKSAAASPDLCHQAEHLSNDAPLNRQRCFAGNGTNP